MNIPTSTTKQALTSFKTVLPILQVIFNTSTKIETRLL